VQSKLAMVPEGRGVFTRMSIHENLLMGAYTRSDKAGIEADIEKWYGVFPRLKERSAQLAGTLSGGEQQMLAMARALMCHPTLLLLDEPSMGLAPIMVEKIFEVIRDVSKQGITILLVEQNAKLALQAAHRAYVMESGAITMSGECGRHAARSAGAGGVPGRVRQPDQDKRPERIVRSGPVFPTLLLGRVGFERLQAAAVAVLAALLAAWVNCDTAAFRFDSIASTACLVVLLNCS
jgi:ABC-type multidrug transport system ATPase subunit